MVSDSNGFQWYNIQLKEVDIVWADLCRYRYIMWGEMLSKLCWRDYSLLKKAEDVNVEKKAQKQTNKNTVECFCLIQPFKSRMRKTEWADSVVGGKRSGGRVDRKESLNWERKLTGKIWLKYVTVSWEKDNEGKQS